MTAQELAQCTGARIDRAEAHFTNLEEAMALYAIDTPTRQAAFLAQIGHESGGLRYLQEIWGPTETQRRYETRQDLGNNQPGDGRRFAGHGFIQVTGRFNHAAARDQLRARFGMEVPDFEQEPEKLAEPYWAAMSAANFWSQHDCNRYADSGDFDGVSDVINRGRKTAAEGDSIGYQDRLALYRRATEVLA
jgi:putative chitinase